jgi:hypothetical protein
MQDGDIIEWVGPAQTVGPHKEIAISTGDQRKVVAVNKDGKLLLEGRHNKGCYGFVDPVNVKKVHSLGGGG